MNNLMFQVIFIFSDWILIKQPRISYTSLHSSGKQILEKMPPRWNISNLPQPE